MARGRVGGGLPGKGLVVGERGLERAAAWACECDHSVLHLSVTLSRLKYVKWKSNSAYFKDSLPSSLASGLLFKRRP